MIKELGLKDLIITAFGPKFLIIWYLDPLGLWTAHLRGPDRRCSAKSLSTKNRQTDFGVMASVFIETRMTWKTSPTFRHT